MAFFSKPRLRPRTVGLPGFLEPLRPLDHSAGRVLWLARDRCLHRLVVAKRLAATETVFSGEAALSRVNHAVPATIYGLFHEANGAWLVSEYIDGVALNRCARLWPVEAVLPMLLELTSAVQALVTAGVAHADIAPGNVLIDASGSLRLVDFELAAHIGDSAKGAGTPGFAAPESAQRCTITSSSDLWSVAALGVWLLTGECPGWILQGDEQLLALPAWHPTDRKTERVWRQLMGALALDPSHRPPLADWQVALQVLARLPPAADRALLRDVARRYSGTTPNDAS